MNSTTIPLITAIVAAATLTFAQEPAQREMTEEEKARISAKAEELVKTVQRLDETNRRLDAAKERIRAKFAPKVEDAPDLLWGKMLRFRACKMPDDACLALDLIRRKKSPDFHSEAIKAAKALCQLGDEAPTLEGVMISSYEPPATSHAIFKPGDIVVARDGNPIRRVPDWKTNVGSRYRFWRLGADGKFQLMEAILPAGQPRVGLLNVAEEGAAEMARTYADELEAMKNDALKKRDEAVAELNARQNARPDYQTVSKLRAAAARGSEAFSAEVKRLAVSIASNLRARDLTMESYANLLATLAPVEEIANDADNAHESIYGLYETIADTATTARPKSVAKQLEIDMRLCIAEYALRNANLGRAESALAAVRPLAANDERVQESLLLLGPPLLLLQGKDGEALRMWDAFLAAQRAMTHGEAAARASDETWTEMMGHLLKDMKKNGVRLGAMAARFPEL